jgi:ribonuclease T1
VSFSGRPPWWQALRHAGLVVTLAGAVSGMGWVQARGVLGDEIRERDLPGEARATLHLIVQGGPFAHHQDGAVFGNRERSLLSKPRGYYHEYTVATPGAHDRGARRIVCGGVPPTRPEACFYSADHYATFRRIAR